MQSLIWLSYGTSVLSQRLPEERNLIFPGIRSDRLMLV
jgi:hypothetical protein